MSDIRKIPPFLLFFLFALSQSTESAYTTGLTFIAAEFGVDSSKAQITSSVYFYGFAFGILILGRVSDILGRRPVIIFGLSVFTLSGIICSGAHKIEVLILARFMQAFGASVCSVVAQAMARDSYNGVELSRLYAGLSAALAVSPSISSLIGGNIVSALGWRYVFYYFVILGLFMTTMLILKAPETNKFKGVIKAPFFEVFKFMIRDKKVMSFALIIGGFNAIMYSFYIEAPFIFISKLSVDPANYGYLILLLGVAAASGGAFSRYLLGLGVDGKTLIKWGINFSMFACFSFFLLAVIWSYRLLPDYIMLKILILPMILQSSCYSIVMPLVLRYSLEDYAKVNGTAGSIFGCLYYCVIATSNFITSCLHDDINIIKVSLFFFLITLSTFYLFKLNCSSAKINSPYRDL